MEKSRNMNVTDTLQKLSEAAAGQGNAFKSIYEVALKATEQVFSLNTDFARSFFEGAVTYPAGSDYQQQLAAQCRQIESASTYFLNISDVWFKSQAEMFTLGSANAEALSQQLSEQFEHLVNALPADPSKYSEALNLALNAAKNACEKVMDTSRQISASTLVPAGRARAPGAREAA
jgi:cell division septum initiation protein DivIVA